MAQQTNHQKGMSCHSQAILPGSRPYYVNLADDSYPYCNEKPEPQLLTVESVEDAVDLLRLLGDTCCEPLLSSDYRQTHPGLYEKLRTVSKMDHSYGPPIDIDRAAVLMKKMPLDLRSLINSPLALCSDDQFPPRIDKRLVHKDHEENILISEPWLTGWIRYFNVFCETTELNFDHGSEHVQGMLLLEALRQAGIASAHCQGLPLSGKLALVNYNTNFSNFLTWDYPILCRTYCSFTADETSPDQEACIYIQVFQYGRLCIDAVLKAFAYINEERANSKEKRLKKIMARQKENFELKIKRIYEPMISEQCE
ncbi:MAG TPA: hypothetical protein ENL01_00270 [Chlorobaculum parvum]|uniref:A-factor biosynthesis hotdog domain-containing protein n=1 Tax=Chlorobaculum parvum TaxID=274539 RepID=A0A7C5DHH6_9CHLB|nr:hypothetical protein [Chlorobaculum parvum]